MARSERRAIEFAVRGKNCGIFQLLTRLPKIRWKLVRTICAFYLNAVEPDEALGSVYRTL
jgi:hypothetical protein